MNFFAVGIFMFKYIFILPNAFNSMFSYQDKIYVYNTSGANQLHLEKFPMNLHLNGLLYCGAKLWNDIFLSFTGDVKFIYVFKACFKDISLTELPTILQNHVYILYNLYVRFSYVVTTT